MYNYQLCIACSITAVMEQAIKPYLKKNTYIHTYFPSLNISFKVFANGNFKIRLHGLCPSTPYLHEKILKFRLELSEHRTAYVNSSRFRRRKTFCGRKEISLLWETKRASGRTDVPSKAQGRSESLYQPHVRQGREHQQGCGFCV